MWVLTTVATKSTFFFCMVSSPSKMKSSKNGHKSNGIIHHFPLDCNQKETRPEISSGLKKAYSIQPQYIS